MRHCTHFLRAAVVAALVSPASAAETPRLRATAAVSGDTIKLGDLIEGLGERGDAAVFRAPAPGGKGTIQAARVIAAAKDYGVVDVDQAGISIIAIARAGATISRDAMVKAIEQAIGPRPEGDALDISLDATVEPKVLDAMRAGAIRASDLRKDEQGRFEARLTSIADASGVTESWIVTGTLATERDVMVPVEGLTRGEPITEKDLMVVKRPITAIPRGTLVAAKDLVGLIPRRNVRAGEPVRDIDVVQPNWVERGQVVTVVFQNRGLILSMRGRALANGAEGATVKVQNPQSKRIIEGTVSGPGQVTLAPNAAEILLSAAQTGASPNQPSAAR